MSAKYYRHKFKHMACGLHFIVCSWKKEWPPALIHCPECGGTGGFMVWKEELEGFIFEDVPGGAEAVGLLT